MGVGLIVVEDDFGDVYGVYYLLIGEGYLLVELESYVKFLCCDLLFVDGVVKVGIIG